jgi:hypothetical protein
LALFWSEMLCPSFTALESACPSLANGPSLRFANRILSFAYGNIEYLLGKLYGVARTFGHETSMPQAALPI